MWTGWGRNGTGKVKETSPLERPGRVGQQTRAGHPAASRPDRAGRGLSPDAISVNLCGRSSWQPTRTGPWSAWTPHQQRAPHRTCSLHSTAGPAEPRHGSRPDFSLHQDIWSGKDLDFRGWPECHSTSERNSRHSVRILLLLF